MTMTVLSGFLTFCKSFPFLPESRVTRKDARPSSYPVILSSLNFLLALIVIKDGHCIDAKAEQSWQRVSSSNWKSAIQSQWTSRFSDYPVSHWGKCQSSWGMAMTYGQRNQSPIFHSFDPSMILLRNYFLKIGTSSIFGFFVLVLSSHP